METPKKHYHPPLPHESFRVGYEIYNYDYVMSIEIILIY